MIAYQVGKPEGYNSWCSNEFDGIALTYGSQKNSIWSFVAALEESDVNTYSVSPSIPSDIGLPASTIH